MRFLRCCLYLLAGYLAFHEAFSFLRMRQVDLQDEWVGRAQSDMSNLRTQLAIYQILNGAFPSTQQGLNPLVAPPADLPQPNHWRQLRQEIPVDPWGTAYQYRFPATSNRHQIQNAKEPADFLELFSCGPDQLPDTPDDVYGTDHLRKSP